MSKTLIVVVAALFIAAAAAADTKDPAAAVAAARQHMAKKEFRDAVRVLGDARLAAEAITKAEDRTAALSAIHFLSAVSYAELGKKEEAETNLRSFFKFRPGATISKGSFPDSFTRMFESVRRDVARETETGDSFDGAYPGFATVTPSSTPIDEWGRSSAAILLATDEEKGEWARLETDAARAAFIEAFWKKRDPHPNTPANEFREEVERRIAFADMAFDEAGDRHGALSDRGRVFVLIGKPQRVTTRPLTRTEAGSVTGRGMRGGGGLEVWEYRHEQLPASIPTHGVEFRFVASGNDPRRTMQRDFMPLAALDAAKKAIHPKTSS